VGEALSSLETISEGWVDWQEQVAEFPEAKSSVLVSIVASHEELGLRVRAVHTKLLKSLHEVRDRKTAEGALRENAVCLFEAEVFLAGKGNLPLLENSLDVEDLLKAVLVEPVKASLGVSRAERSHMIFTVLRSLLNSVLIVDATHSSVR